MIVNTKMLPRKLQIILLKIQDIFPNCWLQHVLNDVIHVIIIRAQTYLTDKSTLGTDISSFTAVLV